MYDYARLLSLIPPGSRVAFSGSRTYTRIAPVKELLLFLRVCEPIVNVGDATGLDETVREVCTELDIDFSVYRANWTKYKRQAGMRRNYAMIMNSDYLIVFYDELTPGTKNAIDTALKNDRIVLRGLGSGFEVV